MRKKKNEFKWEGRCGGVGGRETIIRIYCMGKKSIFSKIEKKKNYGCTHPPV